MVDMLLATAGIVNTDTWVDGLLVWQTAAFAAAALIGYAAIAATATGARWRLQVFAPLAALLVLLLADHRR